MVYLLYNSLSNKGKGLKACQRLEKKLRKNSNDIEIISLLELVDGADLFVSKIKKEDDIYIIGGDGTLHNVINSYDLSRVKGRIFYSQGGSGNDFCRGRKQKTFEITDEIKSLPTFKTDVNERRYFFNGVGLGIDADICKAVSLDKISYLKATLKCLKTYKPYSVDIEIDGENKHFDNVCFFAIMNGKYFGGGMKIAPSADRFDDHLDLIVISIKKPSRLIPLIPTVFIGKHVWFKKIVHTFPCKQVKAVLPRVQNLQADGEVTCDVKNLSVSIS